MIDEAVRRRLKYVRVSDPDLDLSLFPDFLIVGPQRTGTTWLHANLREHPEVFLSEPKELFFFSRLKTPEHPRYKSNELGWYLSCFRDPPWRSLLRQALSLRNHRRLYRPKIRGEATASYAALDGDVIDEIAALNPRIKVIMMVRNPIDRAWSHATKDLARNRDRKVADVSDEEFRRFFSDPYQVRCAQYSVNLENWRSRLGEEQVFVGAFDDVAARPEALLTQVMAFLGVSADPRYLGSATHKDVNPAGSRRIPEQHRLFLASLLEREVADWQEKFAS